MDTEDTTEVTDTHLTPKLNLSALKVAQYTDLQKEVHL